MSTDVSVKIDEDLKCPVCLEVFSDPVRLACDHCFCLTCLQQLWHGPTTDESQNRSCPECKRNYQVSPAWRRDPDLQARAVRVRSLLEAASRSQSMSSCDHCLDHSAAGVKTCLTCDTTLCAKHLRPHLNQPAFRAHTLADVVSGEDGELRKCGRHNELLKLYCQDDRVCVCALCVVIGEHKNHSVITAEEAYEHLQENWAEAQIKVKFQGKEAEGAVNDLLRMQNVAVKAAEEAQKDLEGRYRHLLDLLHEDEQNARCLVQAEEGLARAAAGRQIKRWLARRDDLQSLATVLDRLLSVGDIYEVLKNVRSTDTRVRKVLEGPLPVVEPVNLSTPRITSLCSQAEDLECNLTHLLPRCWTNFCNVTLDPRTAHPCLEISADLQSVSWSRSAHGPSESAERYDTRYNVLGQQLFSAGTHYWEVAVGSKSYWVVGLATRSAPRKGGLDPEATDLGMNKESWALFHCGDIYTASHDRQSVPVTIQAPLRKLGILLDYFAGQIQFYDADRRAILHTFSGTFSQALSPALNPCANRDDTNEDPLVLVHLAKEGR